MQESVQEKIDKGIYPSKEKLVELYIDQNQTRDKICGDFNISTSTFKRLLKRYNICKNPMQRYINIQQTFINKYGYCNPGLIPKVKEKIKQTNLKKYGCQSPAQNKQVKEKIKQTNLQKYGCTCTLHNPNIAIKTRKTILIKYKCKYISQNKDIQDKIRQTNLIRYGWPNPLQNGQIKEKIKQTSIHKYGCQNPVQKNIYHLEIWNDPKKLYNFLISKPKQENTVIKLSKFFNVSGTSVTNRIHEFQLDDLVNFYYNRSHYEDDIIEYLKNQLNIKNIIKNDRSILQDKEIDIYLPDYKFGIEFNGDYWHSDIQPNYQDHNGRSVTHQNKSLEAELKGIQLFHIFEYEWNNIKIRSKILDRLSCILQTNIIKIPARKCIVKELTKKDKNTFLDANHIQGADRYSTYSSYGLYYKDQLVACMSFSHSKFKKYNYELSRFCSLRGYNIQGGASKLFKHFVDNKMKTGENIVSYNDITKTSGKIYEVLGFKCVSVNMPNYVWINFDTGDIRTRYQEQAAGEVERMHSKDYHRVCDCGTKTWIYIV